MRCLVLVLCALFFYNQQALAHTEPTVDLIVIEKSKRLMTLYSDGEAVKDYRIALGFAPTGDKLREGDGKTPEGRYRIDYKNPHSQFHLSLRISYPDKQDRAAAKTLGYDPGGDIFIHGTPGRKVSYSLGTPIPDWTHGCIAVTNNEIEEIWKLVSIGAIVDIRP